jgi:hypothetical protein
MGVLFWLGSGDSDSADQDLEAPDEAAATTPTSTSATPTWRSTQAKISDVTAEFVSPGLWNLIVTVDHNPPSAQGQAVVDCSLRQGEPQQHVVRVPVELSPGSTGGEYEARFHIPRRWADGQYPVVCTVDGAPAYEGDVAWSRGQ